MLSRYFFPNFGQGPFPKITGKSPVVMIHYTDNCFLSISKLHEYVSFLSFLAIIFIDLRMNHSLALFISSYLIQDFS